MTALPRRAFPVLVLAVLASLLAFEPASARTSGSAKRIVSIARAELAKNVREIPDGSNRGTRIRMYGSASASRFYPAPWCAYFVSWVTRKAGRPIGPSGSGFGYVPYIRAWAKSTGKLRITPRPGDIILFPQHTGIVESVYKNRTLTTIEGNASNRVMRRWRKWKEASAYVRIAAGGQLTDPGDSAGPERDRPAPKPRARIKAYPGTAVAVGQRIDFTSNESRGDIRRAAWDLDGDGRYESRGDSVSKSYDKPGSVKVRLKVTDRRKRTSRTAVTVKVRADQAPVAALKLSSTSLKVGEKLYGDASGSHDPDGKIVRYDWDLNGDGVFGRDDAKHDTRMDKPGVYHVGVRVTDDAGNQASAFADVTVTGFQPPAARLTCDATQLHAGAAIRCSVDTSGSESRIKRYEWDMDGDGSFGSDDATRSYTYPRPGQFRVRVRVTDVRGLRSEASHQVTVVNDPPVARLKLSADAITVGQTLYADASDSHDPDGKIVRYDWDFDGDGAFTRNDAKHEAKFTEPGVVEVRVRATDNLGATAEASLPVTVLPRPLEARIAVPDKPQAEHELVLDGGGSVSPDTEIVSYDWDLDGDGSFEVHGRQQTVTYATHGPRTVRLRVTDDAGRSHVAECTFTVLAAPRAAIRLAYGTPRVGQTLGFYADGSSDADGTISKYQWDFNADGKVDKTTSSFQSGNYRFWSAGTNTVRVTAIDSSGLKDTAEMQITVAP